MNLNSCTVPSTSVGVPRSNAENEWCASAAPPVMTNAPPIKHADRSFCTDVPCDLSKIHDPPVGRTSPDRNSLPRHILAYRFSGGKLDRLKFPPDCRQISTGNAGLFHPQVQAESERSGATGPDFRRAGQRLTATGLPSRKGSCCGVHEPPDAPLRSGWIVSLI